MQLTISRTLLFVIAVLGVLPGCSSLGKQVASLKGTSTEQFRTWDRDDPSRKKLIVFVHGFNSNKDDAWGQFQTLLKDDPDFDNFNLHRFGYPTNRCRQVADIRDEGEYLASFLKSTVPRYQSVVLVGHSMGGLVILQALLTLERQHLELIKNADIRVLTFGTPFLGVENTSLLLLFCENEQANRMGVLNTELSRLTREWAARFNRSERETPQVPIYAFRGINDNFLTEASACGVQVISCEVVDGDHISVVKPTSRDHLAYQMLKELALKPNTSLTAQSRIGISEQRIALGLRYPYELGNYRGSKNDREGQMVIVDPNEPIRLNFVDGKFVLFRFAIVNGNDRLALENARLHIQFLDNGLEVKGDGHWQTQITDQDMSYFFGTINSHDTINAENLRVRFPRAATYRLKGVIVGKGINPVETDFQVIMQ